MNYDVVRFERGQLWMVRFKHPEGVGHEQQKDRPYLVLSVGRFNKSSGMVTMVPLTSQDKSFSPAHVTFTNLSGTNNTVLCEQIRTFDYMSGAYIFDFIGNVSDEILEKVDVALSVHLGLHYSPITLKSLYDSMEAIIKSVGYMQQKANTPKFTDDDVIQFAEKLQMLAVETPIEEVSATNDEDANTIVPDVSIPKSKPIPVSPLGVYRGTCTSEELNESSNEDSKVELTTHKYGGPDIPSQDSMTKVEVKSKRNKWTKERCEEFIHDANTLPMKEAMEKWDISKKTRFYSMKNYVNSLLLK